MITSSEYLTSCQSGFIEGDSCVNQLLSITHEIQKNVEANPSIDTTGVLFDMSKAFDKVWHKGLLCKLQSYGVKPEFFYPFKQLSLQKEAESYTQRCHILMETYYAWRFHKDQYSVFLYSLCL